MGCKVSVSIVHPEKNDQDDQEDQEQIPDYETPKKNPVHLGRYDSLESLVSISSPDSP